MIETIIGRNGSTVLLFQVDSATAQLPCYIPVGTVYDLGNLLCFIESAPKAVAVAAVLPNLVNQAGLEDAIETVPQEYLLPHRFQIVNNSLYGHTKTLVEIIKMGTYQSPLSGDKGNFFRMKDASGTQICIGKGSILPSKKPHNFKYALHSKSIVPSTKAFDDLFDLVIRYLRKP